MLLGIFLEAAQNVLTEYAAEQSSALRFPQHFEGILF